MSGSVGDALVSRLIESWGVKRVFGYPGDGIDGVIGALARHKADLHFLQVRHEEMAAFMACGHAKYTGEVGTCLATSGPGAAHLLTGLYDAKADRQPVVAIVGQTARTALGGHYQQEIDLPALFHDVTGGCVQTVTAPAQLRHVIDRAYRTAIAERAPTCIILPADVQELKAKEPPREHWTVHSGAGYSIPRVLPHGDDLAKAAAVLNAGKRVSILIGNGAANAADLVVEVADVLGAGIAKALLGKPVLPDDLPFVTGGIGLLGTGATHEMMTGCDTLLMIGSGFPYGEFLPKEGQARGVQIDIDPARLSLRYPMEVNLAGDSAETLQALLPLIERKTDRSWREKIEGNVSDWWKTLERRAMQPANPLNPQRVMWELSPHLPENAMVACDTGSTVYWYSRDLKLRKGMLAAHSGNLASMGAALPYAIAGKFAFPDRAVIALVGDGAMQMNGINELITVAKYWRSWRDPRFVVLVMNNRDLNMVTWEQRVLQGDPKFEDSQDLPDFSYAGYAKMLGFDTFTVSDPESLSGAWEQAFACERPVLVEAIVDPDVPPLPPHISAKQARHYLMAILKGDPSAAGVIRESLKQLFA
jgi:pyruvate dehydrogenase (quinone)